MTEGPDAGAAASPIRRYRPADVDALYRVCLLTGDSGAGASDLYSDPRLLGDVFVGPYVRLHPELAFVLDDGTGAEGYVLGALDTAAFGERCEREWWPHVRERYRDFTADPRRRDRWILDWIASPPAPPVFVADYPSHLHIDLLPRWQRGGWGKRLMLRLFDELRRAGSSGVHLGAGAANTNAVGFYRHLGFETLAEDDGTVWMGMAL